MKIYHYLDIVDHESISKQVYDFLRDNYDLDQFIFWNTVDHSRLLSAVADLKSAISNLNLSVAAIAIIKTKIDCKIHVDYSGDTLGGPRLLWPIRNCNGSSTRFFDVKPEWLEIVRLTNGVKYCKINNPEPLVEIDRFELNRPVIFNPQVAHGVYCNPEYDDYRYSMTISIRESLDSYLT